MGSIHSYRCHLRKQWLLIAEDSFCRKHRRQFILSNFGVIFVLVEIVYRAAATKTRLSSKNSNRTVPVSKKMQRTQFYRKSWIKMHGLDVSSHRTLTLIRRSFKIYFHPDTQSIRWRSANLRKLKWLREWSVVWRKWDNCPANLTTRNSFNFWKVWISRCLAAHPLLNLIAGVRQSIRMMTTIMAFESHRWNASLYV